MSDVNVRKAIPEDAEAMANILREIGWSEKRNSMPLQDVAKPIGDLIDYALKHQDDHTIYVAVDDKDKVIGFTNVHWVPFVMLGSYEGYITDVFVSPGSAGKGAGSLLVKTVMKDGEERGCMRLMLTNGKDKLSYKKGFYEKLGWTERPKVANFVYYYKEPWN